MIQLDVEYYCHTCPNFEPVVAKLLTADRADEQSVRCEYRDQCANVANRVAEQIRKDIEEKLEAENDPDAGKPWSYEIMKHYR